jgi:hypothetical protein
MIVDCLKRRRLTSEANGIDLIPMEDNGINSAILWYSVDENESLRKIHNQLYADLPGLLGIENSWMDGDYFRFHTTIFYGKKEINEYRRIYENEKKFQAV